MGDVRRPSCEHRPSWALCLNLLVFTLLPSQEAIRWSIRSGQLHNVQSARVSMPAQIKRVPHSQVAVRERAQIADTLVEEPSKDDGKPQRAADSEVFTWRVDLAKTGP